MQNVHHCSHKQVCEHRVIIYSICCLCCIFSHSVVHYQHTQVIHNMAAFCIYNVSCLHQPVLLNTSSEAGDTNYCVQWRVMIDRLLVTADGLSSVGKITVRLIQRSRAQACTRIVNSTAVCPREGQVIHHPLHRLKMQTMQTPQTLRRRQCLRPIRPGAQCRCATCSPLLI